MLFVPKALLIPIGITICIITAMPTGLQIIKYLSNSEQLTSYFKGLAGFLSRNKSDQITQQIQSIVWYCYRMLETDLFRIAVLASECLLQNRLSQTYCKFLTLPTQVWDQGYRSYAAFGLHGHSNKSACKERLLLQATQLLLVLLGLALIHLSTSPYLLLLRKQTNRTLTENLHFQTTECLLLSTGCQVTTKLKVLIN